MLKKCQKLRWFYFLLNVPLAICRLCPCTNMARPGKIIKAEQCPSSQEADGNLAGRLGRMSLGQQVITLAIWPLLEQILSFMVNTVDLILATRMVDGDGRVAVMDALGLGGYAMWLMMILQGAVATGVLSLIHISEPTRPY